MSLRWTKEVTIHHPVYKKHQLVKSGRSKGIIIFMLYDSGTTKPRERFLMTSFLDEWKVIYWGPTEEYLMEKAREMWSRWLDQAGLMPVEAS